MPCAFLPAFRNRREIILNEIFFESSPEKDKILNQLAMGFDSDRAPNLPSPQRTPKNYFSEQLVIQKCRVRFSKEVRAGRMLGGVGQTRRDVEEFLASNVYTIPCGSVPKGDDPHGRVIHDYSYAIMGIQSINEVLLDNSVQYISFRERVRVLSLVSWYIKVDLKAGYRQLPLNPKDWASQVYSLGPKEYYIDVCMPFGKSNSSKIFCHQVKCQVKAFKDHFSSFAGRFQLESYVDDIFGGALSKAVGMNLKNQLIKVGKLTTAVMNTVKCEGPAQSLVVIGHLYNVLS